MDKWKTAVLKFVSCLVLLSVAYLPTLKWMVDRWNAPESYYSHGFLVPIVSVYLIWRRWRSLKKARSSNEMAGLIMVGFGLLTHIVCALLKVYFISGFSLVFVLYGLILFFFGKEVAGNLVFPIFFLLAMIPLPLVLIGNLTVKLKLFVAETTTFILNRIGFPSIRDGSIIRMPNSFILIAPACSGLRSLISLLTLGLLFSYAIKMTYFKKSLLFLSSIPIALSSNVVRIAILAMMNDLYGEKVAMGFFHNFSGFLMFGIAFLGLHLVSRMLEGPDHTTLSPQSVGAASWPRAYFRHTTLSPKGKREYRVSPGKAGIGYIAVVTLLLIANFVSLNLFFRQRQEHDLLDIRTFPQQVAGWEGRDIEITKKEYDILETRNLIFRNYSNEAGQRINLFVVYSETNRSVFHPPEVCLIGSGVNILDKRAEKIELYDRSLVVNKLYVEKNSNNELVLCSYKAGNFYTDNYYLQQVYFALNQLLGRHRGGATIRVSTPIREDEQASLALLEGFMKDAVEILEGISL